MAKNITFTITPEIDDVAFGKVKSKMNFPDTKVKLDFDISDLQDKQKKIREEYNTNVKTLKELNAELKSGKTLTEDQERAYRKAKDEVKEQKKELIDIKKAIGEASKNAEKFGDSFEKANQNTASLTEKFAKIGLAMTGIQQIAGTFDQFLTPFKEFDKQLKNIGTLGVQNFEDFRNAAIDLASGVPDTVAGVTEAVYNAISAGAIQVVDGQADVAEGMKFIEQASKLAVAGLTDTNSAVKSLASATNAYGTDVLGAGQAADILFATVKNGVTTIPELNASLSNVVPIAAAAGISFEQVGAAIATLTKQGVPTAQATTQIRAAIAELMKPGTNLAKVMKEAGVSMESLKQEGLQVSMKKLGDAMQSMGTDSANTFSSIEAIQFALASTGDNAIKAAADLEAIKLGAGSVEEAFAIANEGIGVRVQGILNQIEAVAFKAFGAIGDGAVVAIDAVNKVAPTIMAFASIKDILPTEQVGKFAKTLLQKLIPSLFATSAAQGVLATATTSSGVAMTAAGTAGVASGTATQAAWWPVVAPFVAIGAAISAVIGGFYLLYKNSEGFKNIIDKSFSAIKGFAVEVLGVIEAVGSTLFEVGKTIFAVVVAPFQVAFHTISEIFESITGVISNALSALFSADDASKSFSGMFDGLKAVITNIGDAFKPIQDVIANVMSKVKESISTVINAIRPFAEFVVGVVVVAIKVLYNALKSVVGFIIGNVVTVFKSFFSVLNQIGSVVGGVLVSAFNTISDLFSRISTSLKGTADNGLATASMFGSLGTAIKALASPVVSLYGYFQKAGDMMTFVKATMAGLSSMFDSFRGTISKAWDALTSLDIKGFSSALGNLPQELANGFDKGFNEALNKEKARKKAKETAQAIQSEVKKSNDAIVADDKQVKKEQIASQEKIKLEVLKEYEARKKNIEKQNEMNEIQRANELTEKGLTKTIKDDLISQNAKLEILKQQKEMLEEIVKKYSGSIEGTEIKGIKLDKDNLAKLQSEYAKVIEDMQKSEEVKKGIEIKANIESDSIRKELERIRREAIFEDLKFQLEAEIITEIDYNREVTKLIMADIADLTSEINQLNDKKITLEADDKNFLQIERDITKLQDTVNKKNAELKKTSEAILDATIRSEISAIRDKNEQERKLKLYELAKTYDQQLRQARGNKTAELKVIEEFARKESEINKEYAMKNVSFKAKTLLSFASTLSSALANVNIADNSDSVNQAKDQLKVIDDNLQKLNESYKKGEKSYSEYVKELNKLDADRTAAQQEANKQSIDLVQTLNNALSSSFTSLAETAQATISTLTQSYMDNVEDVGEIKNKIKTTFDADELDSLYSALEAKNSEAASLMGSAWLQFGVNVGAVFSQMLADGNSFLKSTVVAMLSALKAMIPIYIAQIYAKEIASKTFAGIATASALTALLMGVVSAAEAGARKLKFAKGGEVPGGQKEIIVNEEGPEFVVNHKAYIKNKKALLEINKRNISIDQYAKEKRLGLQEAPVRIDTSGLEKRLERIETAIKQEARFKTHIDANINIDDKEVVRRAEFVRRENIRRF